MLLYLRLVWSTARTRVTDHSGQRATADQLKAVYVIQHGRLLMATADAADGVPLLGIASRSGDGDFAERFLAPFGIRLIRGSSGDPRKPQKDKGGRAALLAAREFMQNNETGILALTPDGPKGPRGRCKIGAAVIAAASGAPVIAVAFSARRTIRFNSWDRFMLPLPFTRIDLVWSAPLAPPGTTERSSVAAFSDRVEQVLIETTREADRRAGRSDLFEPAEALPV